MPSSAYKPPSEVDLSTCDKEPIHIPGCVQPHGVLFALNEDDLHILQVSDNTESLLGIKPQDILGKTIAEILGETSAKQLADILKTDLVGSTPILISEFIGSTILDWNILLHRFNGILIMELEQAGRGKDEKRDFFHLMAASIIRLKNLSQLDSFLHESTVEIRKITGFDRVMIYKFDKDGHGTVIAEDRDSSITPYLGQRYPASDIPKQARELYVKNRMRLITDINYKASALLPQLNPRTGAPLDMSHATLRSVSPIHIEYLQNMGVGATLVISLIKNNELWGLIACHHNNPYYVPWDVRMACDSLGHFIMLELIAREQQEESRYHLELKSIQAKLSEFLMMEPQLLEALVKFQPNLGDFISADNAAVCVNGDIRLLGKAPDVQYIRTLAKWLGKNYADSEAFECACLPKFLSDTPLGVDALKSKDTASGILAISLSPNWESYVFWFRQEFIQTIHWAGDPNSAIKVQKHGERLTPRGSFDLWKETVSLCSKDWSPYEIDTAVELRHSILRIQLQKSEAVEERNRQFQMLANSIPQLAWMAEPNGELYWYNQRWYDYTGTTFEEMKGWGWKKVHHPDHLERVVKRYQQSLDNGQFWEDTFPLKSKEGEWRWFLSRALAVRDFKGEIICWFGTNTDITDQMRNEQALRESEAQLRTLTEAMPQMVWSAKPDGNVDYYNKRWFDYTGAKPEDCEGQGWIQLIHPEDRGRAFDAWQQAMASNSIYESEYRLRAADGQYRWFLARAVPIHDEAGRIVRCFGTNTDIEELMQTRELQARMRETLEELVTERTSQLTSVNKELESFAYSISHDLRAPLRGIDGLSQAILTDYEDKLDDLGKSFLNRLRQESQRMGQLIDDVLKLSRLTRGEISKEEVNLSQLAEEMVASFREQEPGRSVNITIEKNIMAQADVRLISLVLQNLFENAWKFTSKNPKAEIQFGMLEGQPVEANSQNVCYIRDNGAGFDMAYADKLFGAFQRLHRIDEYAGTGIGLATVKRIINRHGWEIWAEAQPGKGATFYFTIQEPAVAQNFSEHNSIMENSVK